MRKPRLAVSTTNAIQDLIIKTDHLTLATWATDCAEHVLPYFEKTFSDDKRPRDAIEAGRAWVRGETKMTDARKAAFAAHAAARAASSIPEACSAARAAGHAAATAHVASHAIYAANYAALSVHNAADSNADTAATRERDWQHQHLLKLIERQS